MICAHVYDPLVAKMAGLQDVDSCLSSSSSSTTGSIESLCGPQSDSMIGATVQVMGVRPYQFEPCLDVSLQDSQDSDNAMAEVGEGDADGHDGTQATRMDSTSWYVYCV